MTSESPFSSYFNSNNVPSALEADGIAALIADRGEAASGIRARLERLVKEVQTLQGQLDQHTHHVDKHKAIISSFRRLSNNTLVRIFLASRSHYEFSPIAISHVSRRWRKLVLNIPWMWTTIAVNVDGRTQTPMDMPDRRDKPIMEVVSAHFQAQLGTSKEEDRAILEKVSAYLQRSGALSLYIKVKAGPIHPTSRQHKVGVHEHLADILGPSISRCTQLNVNVPSDSPLMRLLQLPGSSGVSLQSLTIDLEPWFRKVHTPDPAAPPPESMINLRNAQSLTFLSIQGMDQSMVEANVALTVNWSMLTNLRLRPSASARFSQHHVIPILAACNNLEKCSLTFFDPVGQDVFPKSLQKRPLGEIIVPKLYRLDLNGSEVATRGMASRLTLPSLTKLSTMFNRATYPASEEESALVQWLDRFGDQLLDVSFDYGSITQSALAYCLACLPNVTRLSMIGRAYHTIYPFMPKNDENGPYSALIDDNLLESLTPRFDDLNIPESLTPRPDDNSIPESLTPRFDDHHIPETLTPRLDDNKMLESLATRFDEDAEADGSADWEDVCLCPRLQQFFCTLGPGERSEKAFIEFILARYGDGIELELPGGVSRIDKVALMFSYEKPQTEGWLDIVEEVNRAVDARGMALDVLYTEHSELRLMESIYEGMAS